MSRFSRWRRENRKREIIQFLDRALERVDSNGQQAFSPQALRWNGVAMALSDQVWVETSLNDVDAPGTVDASGAPIEASAIKVRWNYILAVSDDQQQLIDARAIVRLNQSLTTQAGEHDEAVAWIGLGYLLDEVLS